MAEVNSQKHWIDNADSYICPVCGLEVNTPSKYPGCKCPKCGFQDRKDVKQSGWISVNDRLPDIDVDVLVYAVGKTSVFGNTIAITHRCYPMRWWNKESEYIDWLQPWQYFTADYEITHWVPLPEAPKEDA